MDDGTFTDYEDNEVQLPDNAKLRIAHSCQVPAETAAAWVRHLADYDVTPLFTQFGRGMLRAARRQTQGNVDQGF